MIIPFGLEICGYRAPTDCRDPDPEKLGENASSPNSSMSGSLFVYMSQQSVALNLLFHESVEKPLCYDRLPSLLWNVFKVQQLVCRTPPKTQPCIAESTLMFRRRMTMALRLLYVEAFQI